jgi:hypothetical protein
MTWRMGAVAAVAAAAALAVPGAPAAGQVAGRLLPDVRPFRSPAAAPLAPRLAAALVSTDLLANQAADWPPFELRQQSPPAREVVATVALGGVLPVWLLAEWTDGAAALVVEGQIFGRFRVERPERDDMGQDWFVGFGAEVQRSRWSGRAMLMHRSSHLGDEFVEETGARRIEFGSEHIDLLAAWELPGLARLYGGGSLIFRSYLNWDPRLQRLGLRDRAIVQLGADREWFAFDDDRVAIVAGVDWHAAQRTEWRRGLGGALGLAVYGRQSGRSLQLLFRYYDGPSLMGEFFLTPERLYGLELQAVF